ncbi:MAG: hypothetical protein DA330_10700 [Nitrososphaera sp.]|nr:hypothetical protein [Nitrososphaera sp.]
MSTKEKIKTIDVDNETYKSLSELAKESDVSIRKYVNEVLAAHVLGVQYMKRRFAHISVVGSTDTSIFLEDKNRNAVATVTLDKDANPYCSLCKGNSCIHVLLSLASLDWRKLVEYLDKMDVE